MLIFHSCRSETVLLIVLKCFEPNSYLWKSQNGKTYEDNRHFGTSQTSQLKRFRQNELIFVGK
jgi:hypothetical protein